MNKEYARPTCKTYIAKFIEGFLLLLFLPVMLIVLAINMPTWHYDKYLEKKHGVNQNQNGNDFSFRAFLLFLGLVLFPISLIYLVVYRTFLFWKAVYKWLDKLKKKEKSANGGLSSINKSATQTKISVIIQ